MKTYSIPDSLADAYHGAGWALAAVLDGQPVALRYLADIAPDLEIPSNQAAAGAVIRRWLDSSAAGAHVRELQALGQVSIGMCSAWEFVEL